MTKGLGRTTSSARAAARSRTEVVSDVKNRGGQYWRDASVLQHFPDAAGLFVDLPQEFTGHEFLRAPEHLPRWPRHHESTRCPRRNARCTFCELSLFSLVADVSRPKVLVARSARCSSLRVNCHYRRRRTTWVSRQPSSLLSFGQLFVDGTEKPQVDSIRT